MIMNNPATEFDTSMSAITKFVLDHGMTKIRYRAIYIWDNMMDDTPVTHFVAIGKKGNKNYVFDLTAHRFKKISHSNLDGPLILEEYEWENRYRIAFNDSLLKYKDFIGEQMAANSSIIYSNTLPFENIEGSKILKTPDWYLNELSEQRVFKKKLIIQLTKIQFEIQSIKCIGIVNCQALIINILLMYYIILAYY